MEAGYHVSCSYKPNVSWDKPLISQDLFGIVVQHRIVSTEMVTYHCKGNMLGDCLYDDHGHKQSMGVARIYSVFSST